MKPKGVYLKEIFRWAQWAEDATIVDLGAWHGTTPAWFSSRAPKGKIYAVEPVEENMEICIKNCEFHGHENITFCQSAISDKDGEAMMNIYLERSEGNSLFEKNKETHVLEKQEKVSTITWDSLIDRFGIKKVDFCKVNIEGGEIGLLKGMTKVFPEKMIIEEHWRLKIIKEKELRDLIKEKGYRIVREEKHDLWCIHERN